MCGLPRLAHSLGVAWWAWMTMLWSKNQRDEAPTLRDCAIAPPKAHTVAPQGSTELSTCIGVDPQSRQRIWGPIRLCSCGRKHSCSVAHVLSSTTTQPHLSSDPVTGLDQALRCLGVDRQSHQRIRGSIRLCSCGRKCGCSRVNKWCMEATSNHSPHCN